MEEQIKEIWNGLEVLPDPNESPEDYKEALRELQQTLLEVESWTDQDIYESRKY